VIEETFNLSQNQQTHVTTKLTRRLKNEVAVYPMAPLLLARTHDKITMSFSRPWNPSTVPTSMSPRFLQDNIITCYVLRTAYEVTTSQRQD